jgi:hypothetical protein
MGRAANGQSKAKRGRSKDTERETMPDHAKLERAKPAAVRLKTALTTFHWNLVNWHAFKYPEAG